LFDTKDWQANAYDRFTIRYGPKRNTTFEFSDSTYNNSGNHYGNKNFYLSKFGLTDDGTTSGMSSYYAEELQELGQVKTNEAVDSSQITVRVIGKAWRQTGYDVKASWETLNLSDSVAGRSGDLQVQLNQMGLGYLRNNEAGFPTISVGTASDAHKAIDVLRAEIDNLGEQNGRIASNLNRVEIAMDATQKQLMTQEKALSQVGETDFTADLIELSKTRIERHQNAALMTQAMSIHQDLVNILI
jgi:flagellin-like hook-associated protein FlgL